MPTPDDVDRCINSLTIGFLYIRQSAKEALDEHTKKVFQISSEKFCPVDTGALKASGQNVVLTDTINEYSRRISFGGSHQITSYVNDDLTFWGSGELLMRYSTFVDYAWWVHEILSNMHTNPPTACAKFLERAVNETNPELFKTMDRLRKRDNRKLR
jgi:hypothetical protein